MNMLIDDIQHYHDQYIKWLKDKTCLKSIGDDLVEITTPHLDRHNDCLQFYVEKYEQGLMFTDGGYILDDLEASGVVFNTEKRKKILHSLLAGFGVHIDGQCLTLKADATNFSIRKNNFIQAMLAVNNMFALATNTVSNLFHEDVALWLESHDVRCIPNIKLTGLSGFDFMFDFGIPKHREHPERMIQVINNPTQSNIEQVLFSWHDTKQARSADTRLYVAINDDDYKVSNLVKNSLIQYDTIPMLWTQRNQFVHQLTA